GFRSKPVLQFWMMAAGMRAVGLAADGGYSGEMVHDARTMVAVRLPFVLSAIFGLAIMWWMLARLVNRRVAWLALLVVGSCPFYCLVSRQAMPDMPLVACTVGALALFAMAIEDGDAPIRPLGALRVGRHLLAYDARHLVVGVTGGFVVWQALYDAIYFTVSPGLAVPARIPPAIWLPLFMVLLLFGTWSGAWGWARSLGRVGERLLGMAPIRTMRQLYLLGCYSLLGVSILAKGPPGLAVVGLVGIFHVVLRNRWRALYRGEFELKRGLLLMIATFLPWHLAMFLKDGVEFVDQYLFTHILDRAAVGVDNSPGTFEAYTSQLGHGMWLWAALVPAALAAAMLRARDDTREGRVRFLVVLWAIAGMFFFSIVQTKFHHYILPIVPALGILVAFFLDDVLARRDRLHPLYAALGIAIVLLVARDLMWSPQRWIEMFVYRYDRPWPSAEPYSIDPSDGFLVLAIIASVALALAATPWRRIGVAALGAAGLAICVWCLQVYMPIAGTHWGMREAMRAYYQQRTIYGEKLVYFGGRELYDDWHGVATRWTFETFVPDNLQVGQPMTLTIELRKPSDNRIVDQTLELHGAVSAIGEHAVTVALPAAERARLDPLIARGASAPIARSALHVVDADRLIAWQLYWRGEQFWSGGEIWGYLPEMKTSFPQTVNNAEFTKYLADRTRAPLGRRYFIVSEAGHIAGARALLPTERARSTYEVLDTTSNKFALAAFYM
ncbi:MAG TPA: glycosyltransferase family 39 protein, partial [Kofleriaceae bacterium]|nr:glycosyltransferase family 39 protein [Kofleriaceae bacterium]